MEHELKLFCLIKLILSDVKVYVRSRDLTNFTNVASPWMFMEFYHPPLDHLCLTWAFKAFTISWSSEPKIWCHQYITLIWYSAECLDDPSPFGLLYCDRGQAQIKKQIHKHEPLLISLFRGIETKAFPKLIAI